MRALSEFQTLNEINKSFGQQNKRDVKPPIEATRAIFERFFQIKQQIEQQERKDLIKKLLKQNLDQLYSSDQNMYAQL